MENEKNGTSAAQKDMVVGFDLHGDTLPKFFVEKMLETNERLARQSAHEKEREDIVCRLLASGMTVDDISLILKIRADEIRILESNHAKITIPEYTRTYKARVKSRAKSKMSAK